MVETIVPVVHGSRAAYRTSLLLHVVGATASAAALGAILALAGALAGAPWTRNGILAVVVLAVAYLAREGMRVPIPLPEARRQVPESWRVRYSPPVAAFLYGLGLGTAFATHLSYGTFVVVAGAVVVSGNPALGAALTAPFGVARALAVAAGRSIDSPEDADDVAEALHARAQSGLPRMLNLAALLGLLGAAALQL